MEFAAIRDQWLEEEGLTVAELSFKELSADGKRRLDPVELNTSWEVHHQQNTLFRWLCPQCHKEVGK